MGRTKKTKGDANAPENTKKKHKKNKLKRKKHYVLPELEEEDMNSASPIQRPIKLKIKLGDQLISSTTTIESPTEDGADSLASDSHSLGNGSSLVESSCLDAEDGNTTEVLDEEKTESDISVGKEDAEGGSGVDDEEEEEEAWLDALEAGKVNERGYLPRRRDSSSLTARQKAMLGGEGTEIPGEELMELPTGRSNEEMTEEMMLKKTENNRKRRLAAQKRKEKRKTETVRKLLEKQSTKKKDAFPRKKTKSPHIRYVSYSKMGDHGNPEQVSTLSLPPGVEFSLCSIKSSFLAPPVSVQCAVEGCNQLKKYSDSLTKLPLCSLSCYKTLHNRPSTL